MTHSTDIEGREVSEEETAKGLGFYNVEAFREWNIKRKSLNPFGGNESSLWAEVCNLKQQVVELQQRLGATGRRRE